MDENEKPLEFMPLTQNDIDEIVAVYAVMTSDDTIVDNARCMELLVKTFG